jgi:hypothetical protein
MAQGIGENQGMHAVHERFEAYDRVFDSGNLADLASFYAADATILRDGTLWSGFGEYLSHGPDAGISRIPPVTMRHEVQHVHMLDSQQAAAFALSKVTVVAGSGTLGHRSSWMETAVLSRSNGGPWVIRHLHITTLPADPADPQGKGADPHR